MGLYGQPKIFWAKMLPASNRNPDVAKIATNVAISLTVCMVKFYLANRLEHSGHSIDKNS
jgi:hypothetical protein